MKGLAMQQLSISDIQRNLHKLDSFDIVEIIDKQRDKVKGYFLDSKYVSFIQQLIKEQVKQKEEAENIAGSLHKYAKPELIENEDRGWKEHIEKKYRV
jgi:DNA-binding transcriptional regulator GbsR (MarR family)